MAEVNSVNRAARGVLYSSLQSVNGIVWEKQKVGRGWGSGKRKSPRGPWADLGGVWWKLHPEFFTRIFEIETLKFAKLKGL